MINLNAIAEEIIASEGDLDGVKMMESIVAADRMIEFDDEVGYFAVKHGYEFTMHKLVAEMMGK